VTAEQAAEYLSLVEAILCSMRQQRDPGVMRGS
jgi:hypothetical protein